MPDPRRGAAQVSLMWVIALCVISLVTVFFAYTSQQTSAELQASLDTARADLVVEQTQRGDINEAFRNLSRATGWDASGSTELTALQGQIGELAGVFPSVDPDTVSLEGTMAGLIGDYNGLKSANQNVDREVNQLRQDLSARQLASTQSIGEKDGTITQLRRDLEDTRNSFNTQIVDLERQRDALRDQYRDLDSRLAELRATADTEQRNLTTEAGVLKQRNDILSERLDAVARRTEQPDGSILTVSERLGKGWIDLGRLDRVRLGMQFEIRNASTGSVKGRAEVSRVEENRSEIRILTVADRFDPITPNDLVLNAIFDPTREPVAVLLGDGYGSYSAGDMKALLGEIGILVHAEVSNETDYLILGTPFFDPDTGDLLPWSSQASYKASEALSVQVVPRRDWMSWLGI
jgi:hypothetical protein